MSTPRKFAVVLVGVNLVLGLGLWVAARLGLPGGPSRDAGASAAVVQHLAELIAHAAFRSVITADYAALNAAVNQTASWPELVYVSVEDSQGKILAHTDPTRLGQLWTDRLAAEIRSTVKVPFEDVTAPLADPGVDAARKKPPIGRVRLGYVMDASAAAAPAGWGLPVWALAGLVVTLSVPLSLLIVSLTAAVDRAPAAPNDRMQLALAEREALIDRLQKEAGATRSLIGELQARLAEPQAAGREAALPAPGGGPDEAARVRARVITAIARVFRSSLTNVLGFSKLLLRGADGPLNDAQRVDVENIHAAGLRLSELVTVLSDLVRAEARTLEVHRETIDPKELLEALAADGVTLEGGTDLPPIEADPRHVARMLEALVRARTPDGGAAVTVSARASGRAVEVHVVHPGWSVPEAEAAALFEEFPPVDRLTPGGIDRARLGLALAASLAAVNGGTITAQSRPPGLAFVLTLPRADVGSRAREDMQPVGAS